MRDTLALGESDPFAKALWKSHLERQQRDIEALVARRRRPAWCGSTGWPSAQRLIMAAVAAFFVAGPEASYRLGSALNWTQPAPPAPQVRIDGWIDPPVLHPPAADHAELQRNWRGDPCAS
jgi:hypothetical protein